MCTINDNQIYGSWDIKCNRQNVLSFWAIFCPFTPLVTQKIKISKKWKKKPGDINILHMCTINDNHMYGSWNIECNRQFFVILDHFLPFSHPENLKNSEKMRKKAGDIIILDMCTKNHDHMLYCFWDMPCDECNFHFLFWAILA